MNPLKNFICLCTSLKLLVGTPKTDIVGELESTAYARSFNQFRSRENRMHFTHFFLDVTVVSQRLTV